MGAMEEPSMKKSAYSQLVELQNRNIYDSKYLQSLLDAYSKPSFFIGFFCLQPVNVIFTLKSSLGFEENESSLGNQIADNWVSCDNTVIQLKQMSIENVKGGYYEVYLTVRSYLVLELLKQMYSFLSLSPIQPNHSLFGRHARQSAVFPQRKREQHSQSQLPRRLHQLHSLLLSLQPNGVFSPRLSRERHLQPLCCALLLLCAHIRPCRTLRFFQSGKSDRKNHRWNRSRQLQSRFFPSVSVLVHKRIGFWTHHPHL